jgi:hypothetical protein
MTDREALVLLARSVADAAPASMNEVAEVEGSARLLDHDLPGFEDLAAPHSADAE